MGKAIPYGVNDIAQNDAWVSVGTDHDTPTFAVKWIEAWWQRMGSRKYPEANALFITADAGGSNGRRSRLWKAELRRVADERGLTTPPATTRRSSVLRERKRERG